MESSEQTRPQRQALANFNRRLLFALTTMTPCFALWGCGLTLGPVTKTEIVLVKAGVPVQILENRRVKGRAIGLTADGKPDERMVTVDVGGGIWMPREHWEVIERRLTGDKR